MKTKLILWAALIVTLAFWWPLAVVFGAEEPITFAWEMRPESPPAIGYRSYDSEQSNPGSMRMLKSDILQADLGTPMQATCYVDVPDNAVTTRYFAIEAYNEHGPSGLSDIVSHVFDTMVVDPPPDDPPDIPQNFREYVVEFTLDENGNITNIRVIE